jgi:hypothetical protein
MIDTFPNPWNFSNIDRTLFSVDNYHKIVYYNLNEIAMGAPLGGQCFLETPDEHKIKIHNWCGGPPAWETSGQLLAIPIWKKKFFKGIVQQIGIVDTNTKELKIYSKTFKVLDIRSFDKQIIYGYDSPIHNTKTIVLDLEKEKVETLIKLRID